MLVAASPFLASGLLRPASVIRQTECTSAHDHLAVLALNGLSNRCGQLNRDREGAFLAPIY
jgi:hypothetical protein